MEPAHFLDLAADLLTALDPSPAQRRTAISRAYYAVHHSGAAALRTMGIALPSDQEGLRAGDDHGFVERCWRKCGDRGLQGIVQELQALRDDRVLADYKLGDATPEQEHKAPDCVAQARRLLQRLADATQDDRRRILIQGTLQRLQRAGNL